MKGIVAMVGTQRSWVLWRDTNFPHATKFERSLCNQGTHYYHVPTREHAQGIQFAAVDRLNHHDGLKDADEIIEYITSVNKCSPPISPAPTSAVERLNATGSYRRGSGQRPA